MTTLFESASGRAVRLALVGNPNCGKTSLFNRLTGARAKVANYAGVTVERRVGQLAGHAEVIEIIDLPGTYSLQVTSPDEQVARSAIMGELANELPPDLLIAVVDANHLKLGLRLVLELIELGKPLIVALNMADEARARGVVIDTSRLADRLGVPVVETVAIQRHGVDALRSAIDAALQQAVGPVAAQDQQSVEDSYARIDALMAECTNGPGALSAWQDRLDAVVMHPILGAVLLLAILFFTFQAVFAWAKVPMDLIQSAMDATGSRLGQWLPAGILHDFLVDGLIAGVGSVLVFLPQIIILFAFILALEDSGYLPRAAFLLDRAMRGVGLSGRAFIPMLSSFACAVPGIMATRTIQDPRERLITTLVAPLMTCSARLPIYTLVIAAVIPDQPVGGWFNLRGLVLFALYLAGIVSAAIVAWVLRRGQREQQSFPLLMELPRYRLPNLGHLLTGLKERIWIFLNRVGTIILALSILIWFLANFPHAPEGAAGTAISYSFAGKIGAFMQPLFAPLGFNWQMCVALIPAMAAREVAVATLATVYAVGAGDSAEAALTGVLSHAWTLPVALAYLAWFVYAPQCISTLATVRRETNSARTTALFAAYLFALAYLGAWATHAVAQAWLG